MTDEKQVLICNRCNVALEPIKAHFTYLKRSFEHQVLRCPKCGQVYLDEELTGGRMAEVEAALEEK